ncbi:MAG: peroxide stress protein YaaA [Cellvibrionaceae bacterium]
MLIVISPAKTLDYETPPTTKKSTQPTMLDESQLLIDELRHLAPQDISKLMNISDKLGTLNYDRYQQWQQPFTKDNAKQALLAFKGDVYTGLDAESLNTEELAFSQKHLRILSGLYGLLRPLDLMQAYRLEMGTKFNNSRGKDLYQFWGELITQALNKQLKSLKSETLVNLASNEYFKSVKTSELNAEIITPIFKDKKNGQYKIISFYAKKARGLMSAYAIKKGITEASKLKRFNWEGYRYNKELSKGNEWVFTRDEVPSNK